MASLVPYERTEPMFRTHHPLRGGVIPYLIDPIRKRKLFCFGVDATHQELTDFGGGMRKADPSMLDGMLRELDEEGLGVFNPFVNLRAVERNPCILSKSMTILFLPLYVGTSPDTITRLFNEALNQAKNQGLKTELSGLVWMDENVLEKYLHNETKQYGPMYWRVQRLLSPCCPLLFPRPGPGRREHLITKKSTRA